MERNERRPRVLVVDDEVSIRFGLGGFLQDCDYDVELVASRIEAQASFHIGHHDLVVTDYRLGSRDAAGGLTLARWIKNRAPGTRVVLMTAYGSPALEAEAAQLGCTVLAKPFPLDAVAAIVDGLRLESAA
jgi:DNA-binding NtrC family response regulator